MPNAMIDRLEQERTDKLDFVEKTIESANAEGRDLVDAEKRNLEAARDRVKELDEQLAPLHEFEDLRSASRAGAAQYRPGATPSGDQGRGLGAQTAARGHEYRSMGEIMADAWRAKTSDDTEASRRLESIGRGVVNGTLQVLDQGTARSIDDTFVRTLSYEERAAAPHITTTEIPGLMPVSIVGPVINDIDAERPFLSSIGVKDLGGIPGKTFSRPIVSEHVQMGTQAAEKDELADGQFKVDDVDFVKSTEGGWANVSRQSIDWSSPAMWDALLRDFQDIYAQHTENKAADAFVTAVQLGDVLATVAATGTNPTIAELITALYGGAVQTYNGSKKLPNHVWMSLDMWSQLGITMDVAAATTAGAGIGTNSLQNLQQGGVLSLPRTVVPSFPASTLIIGRKERAEAYEDRLGFLSAVEPKVLGVQLAYGGYFAFNVLSVPAFVELTFT
jgi:hypothetical protein